MKKDKSILYFGLFFAASVLAEVYCIVEKINIIGVSVIVLISTFLFLDSLRQERERSEERQQAFLQDKIDELEKIQKAIYVQTERNSKAIRECLIKISNSENKLAQDIMENQLNTGKLIIKNNREDLKKVTYIGKLSDEKLISVLNKNTERLVRELKGNVTSQTAVKASVKSKSAAEAQKEDMAVAAMEAESLAPVQLSDVEETQTHPTALEALSAGTAEEKPSVPDMPDLERTDEEVPDAEASDVVVPDIDISDTEIPDIELPESKEDEAPEEDLQKISIDMSPEEMMAMLAAEEQAAEESLDSAEPADPNRQLSPDEIASMFASTEPEAEEPKEEPADPNAQMSQDDIAAMFASLDSSSGESKPKEEPEAEVSNDPNHQMSPDEIAALFNSIGQ